MPKFKLPNFLRRKPSLLSEEVCQDITNYLSDNEGIHLAYGADRHDGAMEYRTRTADGKTCWGMYVKGTDLVITDAVVRNNSERLWSQIMYRLENAARATRVTRIIVQDIDNYEYSMFLLRNGYSPGLDGKDYRKLVR